MTVIIDGWEIPDKCKDCSNRSYLYCHGYTIDISELNVDKCKKKK